MLIEFPVSGVPDLGSAISVAQNLAMAAGYTHVSIYSTRKLGWSSFVITVFVADSNGGTQRPTPRPMVDERGWPHWHGPFNCPCGH